MSASAQQERAADVRVGEMPAGGPVVLTAAPAPISVSAPSLTAGAAPSAVTMAAPAAIAPSVASPGRAAALPTRAAAPVVAAPLPTALVPVRAAAASVPVEGPARDATGQLRQGAVPADAAVDAGRATFDGGSGAPREAGALVEGSAASGVLRLAPATGRAPSLAPSIPLRQRAGEAADLGALALGFQFLTGIAFLALGAHASFPALAGVFWVLAGTEMIKQLGKLRGFIVGGWQASHDQKMRHDYGTGRLIDIRGKKYGEDRYDVWAPGRVSRRERFATDATAVLLGLPWVVSAGPKAVALYAAGAATAFAARAAWRRYRPEPAPVDKAPDFEPDR
jgi:hypothetical protein